MARVVKVSSIIVSHHNECLIDRFGARHEVELGDNVFVVNSCEEDIQPEQVNGFSVINLGINAGFSAANNAGLSEAAKQVPDYYLIVNPDVLLPEGWLDLVLSEIASCSIGNAGIYTVPLLGYSEDEDTPTGLIDGVAIKRAWYGRWYDFMQGCDVTEYDTDMSSRSVEAACGALMILPAKTVSRLRGEDGYIFNESYFMYKEDIELSTRVRRGGMKVVLIPRAFAYHCRGWKSDRKATPYWARRISARNEVWLHLRFFPHLAPYSIIKYLYVRFIER